MLLFVYQTVKQISWVVSPYTGRFLLITSRFRWMFVTCPQVMHEFFLSGHLYQPLLDLTSHFHWTFVDPPPLTLFHIGREEVNCLIDLMEPEFFRAYAVSTKG